MIKKAYKYRLHPNGGQRVMLDKTFGCVRVVWNACVDAFNACDTENGVKPKAVGKKELIDDKPWLDEVSAATLQQKQRDFTEFVRQYFNDRRKIKLGEPQFQNKHQDQSFRLPNQKFNLNGNRLRLERIGWVKVVVDRPIPDNARILSCTVSRDRSGRYFASILVEEERYHKPRTGKTIGVDLGIKTLATLSDGTIIENPHFLRENQARLRRAQKNLSRKQKGSRRRERCRQELARLHRKIADKRAWYIHNLTTYLVDNYDVICIEDLNVSGMMRNHKLAGSVSDVSFSEFRRQLEYKCDWYGKELVVIDRFYPSSKTCFNCGWKNDHLALKDRVFRCESCGAQIDRDLNAARNIERVGVDALYNRTWSGEVANRVETSKVL